MTDVLFGQSYFLRFDPKLHRLMQPYAPLGTLIAAAVARDAGYDVAVFDAMLASAGHPVAKGKGDSGLRNLRGVRFGINARCENLDAEIGKFLLLLFEGGQLPPTKGSPIAAIE